MRSEEWEKCWNRFGRKRLARGRRAEREEQIIRC